MDHPNKILPENTIPPKRLSVNFKVLALAFASFLFLALDWFFINKALVGNHDLIFWITPALISGLVISFLTLFSLINYNRWYLLGLTILTFAAYAYIFPKDYLILLGGLGFVALMALFNQRIRSEEKARQDFSIRRVSSSSTGVMIYAFLLLLGINIYYHTSADFKANPEAFYDAIGRSAAKSASYFSGEQSSGIDLNQTVNEFLAAESREQIPYFDTLPENQRQQILEEAQRQFFQQFNQEISADKTLAEAMAEFAVDEIRQQASRFQPFFPIIFTLIIVAILRTFAFIFRWLAVLFTWIIFRVLLSLKFFRLQRVPVEVEKLEI